MTEHDLALSARIRLAMKDSLLTQREFGDAAGLTPDKLSKVLTGKRRVSSLELALMSEASGWSVERLLGMQIDVHGWHAGYAQACEDAARQADRGYLISENCDDIAARIRALPARSTNQTGEQT